MLQVNYIRENKEAVLKGLAKRNKNFAPVIDQILVLDEQRKKLQHIVDSNLAEANKISKKIGDMYKSGQREQADLRKPEVAQLKDTAKQAEIQLVEVENDLKQALYTVPNVPHENVVFGQSAEENVETFVWGEKPHLYEGKKAHWDLIEEYDLIDFELGNKITGAGFPVYKGKGAKLQRALVIENFNLLSWSMKLVVTVLDNFQTKKAKCTILQQTTCI
jgi:seryl-tRNA synthetase